MERFKILGTVRTDANTVGIILFDKETRKEFYIKKSNLEDDGVGSGNYYMEEDFCLAGDDGQREFILDEMQKGEDSEVYIELRDEFDGHDCQHIKFDSSIEMEINDFGDVGIIIKMYGIDYYLTAQTHESVLEKSDALRFNESCSDDSEKYLSLFGIHEEDETARILELAKDFLEEKNHLKMNQILDDFDKKGYSEIAGSVALYPQSQIDYADLELDEKWKKYLFVLIADNGVVVGFDSIEEALEGVSE